MKDMIERQAAIDALDVLCQEHRYKIPGKIETYSQYNEAWQDALDRAEGAIFNLPSAQPEQPWIPCSERLPEDEQPILFSTTTGRVHQGRFHRDNSVNRWYSSLDKMRAYNNVVNAWMPLPEPYKEDDHETD